MSDPGDLVPKWTISTWIYTNYPGSAVDSSIGVFNFNNWTSTVDSIITNYNDAQIQPSSKITQIYPYASDMELPWVSQTFRNNGIPLGANPGLLPGDTDIITQGQFYDAIISPYSDTVTVGCNIIEYFCPSTPQTCPITDSSCDVKCPCPTVYWSQSNFSPPSLPQIPPSTSGPVYSEYGFSLKNPPFTPITGITQQAVVIDGRIDNGYLQGFNDFMTISQAQDMARLIVYGGTSQGNTTKGISDFPPLDVNGNPSDSGIMGIQLDFEPFDSTNPNQSAFYTSIGSLLAITKQYYSIFTFPKAMTTTTATILNSSNNGCMIVPLYDLVDMQNGIPEVCNSDYTFTNAPCDTSATPPPLSATGDATTAVYSLDVPHSLIGYYNAALLTVKQSIAKASITGIKYKFAIPLSSSAHEFEQWGVYSCLFNDFIAPIPNNAYCRMYNGLPINANNGIITQLGYVQMAIKAMQDGIAQMGEIFSNNIGLFRGVDLYAFSYRTVWTPQNPVVDWMTGNIFYGNTPVYVPADENGVVQGSSLNVPYIYSTPAYPTFNETDFTNTQNVLNWLATYGIDPRPQTCGSGTEICLPSECNLSTNTCCLSGKIVVGSGTCCSSPNICGTGSLATCCEAGEKCVAGSCQ